MKVPRSVYSITHNITGRVYVGSSVDVEKRYKAHIQNLRNGKHPVEDMQADFDKYGEDYTVQTHDVIYAYSERQKETELMLKLNSMIRGIGYNYKEPAFCRTHKQMDYKEWLLSEIADKAAKCDDLSTLDFVLKFLLKSSQAGAAQ